MICKTGSCPGSAKRFPKAGPGQPATRPARSGSADLAQKCGPDSGSPPQRQRGHPGQHGRDGRREAGAGSAPGHPGQPTKGSATLRDWTGSRKRPDGPRSAPGSNPTLVGRRSNRLRARPGGSSDNASARQKKRPTLLRGRRSGIAAQWSAAEAAKTRLSLAPQRENQPTDQERKTATAKAAKQQRERKKKKREKSLFSFVSSSEKTKTPTKNCIAQQQQCEKN